MKRLWFVIVVVFLCGFLSATAFGSESAPGVLFKESFEVGDEDLPPDWTVFAAGGDMRRVADVAHDGKYAFLINDNDRAMSAGIRSPYISISAGKEYQVSAWVMAEGEGSQLYLEFWDETKTQRLSAPWVGIYAVPQGGWQLAVNKDVAPENAKYLSVIIYIGKSAVGTSYFDDIEVVAVAQ
jgi:hypothetical protein